MSARAEIRTEIDGLGDAIAKLRAMRERANNLSPAWNAVLTWWAKANREMFTSEGTRWGKAWEPLAPRTIRSKRRGGYPLSILIRQGTLRDSLTRRPFDIEHYDAHSLTVGTKAPTAAFHQHGTSRMPARPIIVASAVKREGVATKAVISWIVDGEARTR